MNKSINFQIIIILFLLSTSLISKETFGAKQDWGEIEFSKIDEASGIVMSKNNQNVFWTHNDSGDKNRIYAFNNKGEHLGEFYIDGAKGRDWEDIAIGPGPIDGKDYIYVGNIGDNLSQFNTKFIYRFIEPDLNIKTIPKSDTILQVDKISFQYIDGKYDAETLMIDPITKDIFILTKRESEIHIYTLVYPQLTSELLTASLVGTYNFYPEYEEFEIGRISGGDISRSGDEILIKSYINVFYFKRNDNQNIFESIIDNMPIKVNYDFEPQGEAICWHANGYGYFTISEEKNDIPTHLYFYPKIEGCLDEAAKNYNPYAIIPNRSCKY